MLLNYGLCRKLYLIVSVITIPVRACFKRIVFKTITSQSGFALTRGANAQNVNTRVSFRWPNYLKFSTLLINQTFVCTPHRRSTTVSLETNPLIHLEAMSSSVVFKPVSPRLLAAPSSCPVTNGPSESAGKLKPCFTYHSLLLAGKKRALRPCSSLPRSRFKGTHITSSPGREGSM